ncbi:MAG: hypothetical protein AAF098_07140 [Pseudomonadota bacterium]
MRYTLAKEDLDLSMLETSSQNTQSVRLSKRIIALGSAALIGSAPLHAAVPVSGFTVDQASTPIGLIALVAALIAIGIYSIRSTR